MLVSSGLEYHVAQAAHEHDDAGDQGTNAHRFFVIMQGGQEVGDLVVGEA